MRLTTLFAPALAAALVAAPALAEEFMTKPSPHSVSDTVERLETAIGDGGAKVIATVDHAAAAGQAQMELRPATLVIFGNPKMGTPIMQRAPSMALALPLRIAVYEDGEGQTQVVYPNLQQVAQQHGVPDGMEQVESAIRALEALTDKAVRAD
jgi:uncharacterized protein (DUF302 family)